MFFLILELDENPGNDVKSAEESRDTVRIEKGSRRTLNVLQRLIKRPGWLVGPPGGQSVEDVGHGDDPSFYGNIPSRETVG